MEENSSTKKVKLIGQNGKMGQALSRLIEKEERFVVVADGEDVVIDFSSPGGTLLAIQRQKPLVCGTTGLSKETFSKLEELSSMVPVLYSPNFSVGMALLFSLLESIPKHLCPIQIEEMHHTEKKDSPSGSSLRIAEILEEDPRNILAKRKPGVVGTHKVEFLFEEETLSLVHQAHSRDIFAKGALTAASFLLGRHPKLYRLQDIFVETNP